MIKAVMFDLDNTLINFWEMKERCCRAAVEAMIASGLKIGKKRALKIIFKIYDKYGIEDRKIFQKFLKKVCGKIDYRILSNAIVAYRKEKFGVLKTYPNVKRTLSTLKKKKLKLAVISDAPKLKCWIRLAQMGIDKYFDVVTTVEDSKEKKPGKLPFEITLKKLKCNKDEALMVGDSIKKDIIGAKRLGIKTVFAKYGYIKKLGGSLRKIADFEIEKPLEIIDIVKKLDG